MTNLSLLQYLQLNGANPSQGVRSCCAPGMKTISLRSLMSGPRIIHISDLHFTDSGHTLNNGGRLGIYLDSQDSEFRSNTVASFLINNVAHFGTNKVIITGDITDSGDDGDYKIAQAFVQKLKDNGFEVYVVPGNHDYCKEGTLVFAPTKDALETIFCIFCPFKVCCLHIPILGHFAPPGAKCPKDVFLGDNATNGERRQRFISYISQYSQYPHVVDFDNSRLILLDSMQGELDYTVIPDDCFAQGILGDTQLYGSSGLSHLIDEYQEQRKAGKKIIICLHHSPFDKDSKGCLQDADKFLKIICDKIDCLLYGHTSPDGVFQQPRLPPIDDDFNKYENENKISLINVENLENVPKGSSYPITVIDLGSWRKVVYKTDGSTPDISWGNPIS